MQCGLPCFDLCLCILSVRGQKSRECLKQENGVRYGERGHCLENFSEMMGLETECARNFLESLFLLSLNADFKPLECLDNASLFKHAESQLSLKMSLSLAN